MPTHSCRLGTFIGWGRPYLDAEGLYHVHELLGDGGGGLGARRGLELGHELRDLHRVGSSLAIIDTRHFLRNLE